MSILQGWQVAQVAYAAGFRGDDLVMAVAISYGEDTSHDTTALCDGCGGPGDTEYSVGLWQINIAVHTQYTYNEIIDPWVNARAAYDIAYPSSGAQPNWSAWGSYDCPSCPNYALNFLPQAQADVQKMFAIVGSPPPGQPPVGQPPPDGQPVGLPIGYPLQPPTLPSISPPTTDTFIVLGAVGLSLYAIGLALWVKTHPSGD